MRPLAAALLVGGVLFAPRAPAKDSCSVRPVKGTAKEQLRGLARVSEAKALTTAIAAMRTKADVRVKSSELEIEDGCLVWSFDLRIGTIPGVQEVLIDAGNGRMLSSQHESPEKEADERKNDGVAKR